MRHHNRPERCPTNPDMLLAVALNREGQVAGSLYLQPEVDADLDVLMLDGDDGSTTVFTRAEPFVYHSAHAVLLPCTALFDLLEDGMLRLLPGAWEGARPDVLVLCGRAWLCAGATVEGDEETTWYDPANAMRTPARSIHTN